MFETNAMNSLTKPDDKLLKIALTVFDFSPANIIKELDLLKPIYSQTSNYGHFGREGFSWERIDKTVKLDNEKGISIKNKQGLL